MQPPRAHIRDQRLVVEAAQFGLSQRAEHAGTVLNAARAEDDHPQ